MREVIADLGPRFENSLIEPVKVGHSAASVFRLVGPAGDPLAYVKTAGLSTPDVVALLDAEAAKLGWLGARGVRVPEVIGHGRTSDIAWLASEPLAGRDASRPRPAAERAGVVETAALAARALHSIDPTDCPFSAPAAEPAAAVDRVVVHGDFCLPNVVIHPRGPSLLDVGEAGVGDRHFDLGLMVGSISSARLNPQYGAAYAERFLDAYGREGLNPELVAAYRRSAWGPDGTPTDIRWSAPDE